MGLEISHKRLTIGSAAIGVAQRIQMQDAFVQHTEISQHTRATGNNLGIRQPACRAQIFNTNLVKLAHPSLLRALIPEHGACIEKL